MSMVEANIITCIINVVNSHNRIIGTSTNEHNRLHALGEPLEDYVKDLFSSAEGLSKENRIIRHNSVFSYGGGKNNPPDAIIKNGDAIEVKKVESIGDIPLNSSYPKSKLYRNDSRISSDCKNIENGTWGPKDIIYAIGCIKNKELKSFALVYGSIYCANKECYENLFNSIKTSINNVDFVLEETNELAHVNAVDPLGITYFRARGMWGISHPFKVFDYIHSYNKNNEFEMVAIIPTEKFNSFANKDELIVMTENDERFNIYDKQVKNPNNTVELLDVKLITYIV